MSDESVIEGVYESELVSMRVMSDESVIEGVFENE